MGLTRIEAAQKLNVHRKTISNWIENGKLILENNKVIEESVNKLLQEKFVGFKKLVWNYRFFQDENPEVAYWAGFLMGDGNIRQHNKSWQFNLTLAEIDRSHLELFCQSLGLDKNKIKIRPSKIVEYNDKIIHSGPQVSITLTDKCLYNDLSRWGIIPNKTCYFIEPTFDKSLLGHYLRGWIDADGSIRTKSSKSKNAGPQIQLIGNPSTIKWLYNLLSNQLSNIHISLMQQYNNKNIAISGHKNCKILYDFCDGNNILRLNRKWSRISQYS